MKPKVLIIGGSGYLGSHLRDFLQESHEVYYTGTKDVIREKYYKIDFLCTESFDSLKGSKFDFIIFLAASLNGLGNIDLNNPDLSINTVKFASFLQFIANENLTERIIYSSSMTVYAPSLNLPVKENQKLEPISVYGLSKKISEDITCFFSNQFKLSVLVLRLPGLFGGSRKSGYIYNSIVKAIENKDININTASLGYWECCEVTDVCNIIQQLLDNYNWKSKWFVMNIGYGEKTDFIETSSFIIKELNSESKILINGVKGYQDFYMSNSEMSKFVILNNSLHTSLIKYIYTCKDEICNS